MRPPQDYYVAVQILDEMGDGGDVYRPTEISALVNISYQQKNRNIERIMQPRHEVDAIKRFHLNVQELMDVLNDDGTLTVYRTGGLGTIKHPNLIASELQNRGYIWIFHSHVKEAQRRLTFRVVVDG